MFPPAHRCFLLSVLAPALTAVALLGADQAAVSPFLPPGSAVTPAAVTQGGSIELHGVMVTPDGPYFSIFDPARKSATWLKLNEQGRPFVVRNYRVVGGSDQVTVDYQGSSLTLTLKTAKVSSAPAGAMVAMVPPPMASGPETNPVPANDAARLQAVAEDIQKRRALRQQAAGGGPVPSVPPVPQQSGPTPR
jgi:hypothetical protein